MKELAEVSLLKSQKSNFQQKTSLPLDGQWLS